MWPSKEVAFITFVPRSFIALRVAVLITSCPREVYPRTASIASVGQELITPVKLKPRPWSARWERADLRGVDWDVIDGHITEKMKAQRERLSTPWEKYDLMKQYRLTIPEEEQNEIYAEVYSELHKQELSRKKMKKKREFVKPKKSG
ncbi:mitochondrial 54S ribosomal protein YmL19 [Homalodisca vitripennis]|nr:mitochondrial 54S ribosomal protein YmL19 [Homalodisca vitripennis]